MLCFGVVRRCNHHALPCLQYVTNGSYMIVQDTKLDRLFSKPGPRTAVRDFLKEDAASPGGPHFTSDRSREVFRYTQHSEGFLLRVKP